ncbi:MAG TPA: hypothetical protein VJR67_03810 [Candidatus Nitrosopolaris sp.]|nr:hypothetical protein [Candidatus Nitrosopolaris sp.]
MSATTQISIKIEEVQVSTGKEIHGRIALNFPGRFDSVVINSQIEDSNDIFNYTSLNGRKINHPYARLSIFKDDLADTTTLEFTAITTHVPTTEFTNAKFRASIIQEHKEVASNIAYTKIVKRPFAFSN